MSTPTLAQRKAQLEKRLEDGWTMLFAEERAGKDVRRWEDFWLSLLSEYERVCDELMRSAA